MIQSMTGYGKHVVQLPSKKITIEIKSLNSKNLDINSRIPQAYREKELELRKLISKSLMRGKVDFTLQIELTNDETSTEVNVDMVKKYIEQLSTIVSGNEVKLLEIAMRMPDTLKIDKEDIDAQEYIVIKKALEDALKAINIFRTEEGHVLETDFKNRLVTMASLLKQVEEMDANRLGAVRERLEKTALELKVELDANRFEQELIYYLEKYDITEEKVRLANHLNYFEVTIDSIDSNGKKLGFIAQEIGREINTIGSKANYAPMQQLVVQMKDELEKVKEQMLNVL